MKYYTLTVFILFGASFFVLGRFIEVLVALLDNNCYTKEVIFVRSV